MRRVSLSESQRIAVLGAVLFLIGAGAGLSLSPWRFTLTPAPFAQTFRHDRLTGRTWVSFAGGPWTEIRDAAAVTVPAPAPGSAP